MSFVLVYSTFNEFVWRDDAGRVHFASQRRLPLARRHLTGSLCQLIAY